MASFIVLKSLALVGRKKHKDAYDICFVLRNWPNGVRAVAAELQLLMDFDQHGHVERALDALDRDFGSPNDIGPVSVSMFLRSDRDADVEQDAFGLVDGLMIELGRRQAADW